MADGSDTPLPVMHHYQCVSCNKSVEGLYGFQCDYWQILNNRSAKVFNIYNAYNLKKQRASLSLEEEMHEIVEFVNKECDDDGGLPSLSNSLNKENNLRENGLNSSIILQRQRR